MSQKKTYSDLATSLTIEQIDAIFDLQEIRDARIRNIRNTHNIDIGTWPHSFPERDLIALKNKLAMFIRTQKHLWTYKCADDLDMTRHPYPALATGIDVLKAAVRIINNYKDLHSNEPLRGDFINRSFNGVTLEPDYRLNDGYDMMRFNYKLSAMKPAQIHPSCMQPYARDIFVLTSQALDVLGFDDDTLYNKYMDMYDTTRKDD